jgi:hypothetical protein
MEQKELGPQSLKPAEIKLLQEKTTSDYALAAKKNIRELLRFKSSPNVKKHHPLEKIIASSDVDKD